MSIFLAPPRPPRPAEVSENPFSRALEPFGLTPLDLWTNNNYWRQEIFGTTRWAKTDEIGNSVVNNRKTCIWSAHGMGKTETLPEIAVLYLTAFYPAFVVITSSSWQTASETIMARCRRKVRQLAKYFGDVVPMKRMAVNEWWPYGKIEGDFEHAILCCSPEEAENVSGRHNKHNLFISDESSALEAKIANAMTTMMQKAEDRIILAGNPLYDSGYFYEAGELNRATDPSDQKKWHLVQISAFDSPNVITGTEVIRGIASAQWVEEKTAEWGDDPEVYNPRVLGIPPTKTDATIISSAMIIKASKTPKPARKGLLRLSVDPTSGGVDKAAFCLSDDAALLWRGSEGGMDGNAIVARVQSLYEEHRFDVLMVDYTGDKTVVQAITRPGMLPPRVLIVPVVYSRRAQDSVRYGNNRAEFYCRFRDALRDGYHIPPEYAPVYLAQSGIKKSKRGQNAMFLESKDEFKERIGRSPDDMDALAQRFEVPLGEQVFDTVEKEVHKMNGEPFVTRGEGLKFIINTRNAPAQMARAGKMARMIWVGENSECAAIWAHIDTVGRWTVTSGARGDDATVSFGQRVAELSKDHVYAYDFFSAKQGEESLFRFQDILIAAAGDPRAPLPEFMPAAQIEGAQGVDTLDRMHLGTLSRYPDHEYWKTREPAMLELQKSPRLILYWPADVLAAMREARFMEPTNWANDPTRVEKLRDGGGAYVRAMRMLAVAAG